MTIIHILLAVTLALVLFTLFLVIGQIRTKNREKCDSNDYKIMTPEQVLGLDLSWALSQVRKNLGANRRGDSFPAKIQLAFSIEKRSGKPHFTSNSWIKSEEVVKIIGAILTQKGWVVYQDINCGAYEIIVDVPRIELYKPE